MLRNMATSESSGFRPTADDFLTIIRRQQFGKLKIYLGPCAGVGKTYQMLIEGNRLKRQGVDVVIGYVEPHDRPVPLPRFPDREAGRAVLLWMLYHDHVEHFRRVACPTGVGQAACLPVSQ